jgi:hypothetical protein
MTFHEVHRRIKRGDVLGLLEAFATGFDTNLTNPMDTGVSAIRVAKAGPA